MDQQVADGAKRAYRNPATYLSSNVVASRVGSVSLSGHGPALPTRISRTEAPPWIRSP